MQHGVLGLSGVLLKVVEGVVQTSRLLAATSAIDNEMGNQREVAELDDVAVDLEVPVVFLDLLAQKLDAPRSALKAFVAANDSHVGPHEAPNFLPVQRNNDGVVGIDS